MADCGLPRTGFGHAGRSRVERVRSSGDHDGDVPSAAGRRVAAGLLAPYDNWGNRVAIDAFVRDIPMSDQHPTHATLSALEADLPKLAQIPSLLVWGMKDWCFREECLRRLQQAWPRAEVVEIADAGHYVIEDAPEETLDSIDRFINRGSDKLVTAGAPTGDV